MSLPCLKSSEFPLALRTSSECLVCYTEHPSSASPPSLPPPHPSSLCAVLQTTLLAGKSDWVLLSPFYLAAPLQTPPGSFPRLHFVHLVWGLPQLGNSSHPTKILPVCPLEPLKGRGCPFPVLLSAQSSDDQPVSPPSSQHHLPSFLMP